MSKIPIIFRLEYCGEELIRNSCIGLPEIDTGFHLIRKYHGELMDSILDVVTAYEGCFREAEERINSEA
jgi:hypothetical protein